MPTFVSTVTFESDRTGVFEKNVTQTPSFVYNGEGIFCTYFCTVMYLKTKKISAENMNRSLKLLDLLYQDLYGIKPPGIDTPVNKEHLEEYGGYLSRFKYKAHAFSYEEK